MGPLNEVGARDTTPEATDTDTVIPTPEVSGICQGISPGRQVGDTTLGGV
jgi:hypothetical protein